MGHERVLLYTFESGGRHAPNILELPLEAIAMIHVAAHMCEIILVQLAKEPDSLCGGGSHIGNWLPSIQIRL